MIPELAATSRTLSAEHDLAVLDLDGVVYIGPEAVPGAAEALEGVRATGMRVCFVTNNASRTPEAVAEHLTSLHVPARPEDVLTSAQVASALLARRLHPGSPVLVIGGTGLERALVDVGLRPVSGMADQPLAVVQGFSPDVGWRMLSEGVRAVRSGVLWVATNLDPTVPTPYGPAPGNGTLVGVITQVLGRGPDVVAGKPQPAAFQEAARKFGSTRPLVVGDRLDTDLEGARAAGMPGLLVLTGVTGASDLLSCPPERRPVYVGRDLHALLEQHPPAWAMPRPLHERSEAAAGRSLAGRGDGSARGAGATRADLSSWAAWADAPVVGHCREAEVAVVEGRLEVSAPGHDALDLLRASCVAAWAWADFAAEFGGRAPAIADLRPLIGTLDALSDGASWAR